MKRKGLQMGSLARKFSMCLALVAAFVGPQAIAKGDVNLAIKEAKSQLSQFLSGKSGGIGPYMEAKNALAGECDSTGNKAACIEVADEIFQLLLAKVGNVSVDERFKYFGKACELGGEGWCLRYGDCYASKDCAAGKVDVEESTRIHEANCGKSSPLSCMRVATRFLKNTGDTESLKKGVQFVEKACESGYAGACMQASRFYLNGNVKGVDGIVAANADTAGKFRKMGCDLGHKGDTCD